MSFAEACAAVCAPGTMFETAEVDVFGIPTKTFVHAPSNIRSLFDLAAARDDDFIVYEDERWTMPDVLAHAGRIGHALVDDFGVAKGDRVAIAMRNYPEWISTFVAITSIGAVAVPLNAWWQTDELVFAIEDSGARVVLADDDRLRRLEDAAPGAVDAAVIAVRSTAGLPDGVVRLEDVLTEGATMPEVEIDTDDDVTILYTSGTTGRPKGAVSTHRAVLNSLMAFAARAAVAAVREPDTAPEDGVTPTGPVFMLPVPLFHVTGLVPVMLGSFVSGAKLVMTHRWDPDRATRADRAGARHELRRRSDDELGPARSSDVQRSRHVLAEIGGWRRCTDAAGVGQAHRGQLLPWSPRPRLRDDRDQRLRPTECR